MVLITASNPKEADKISRELVSSKLAACVNTVPKISSRYRWKGKVETARESLLIAKTKKTSLQALIKKVKSIHSYSVPEIIVLPIAGGSVEYLNWIQESV